MYKQAMMKKEKDIKEKGNKQKWFDLRRTLQTNQRENLDNLAKGLHSQSEEASGEAKHPADTFKLLLQKEYQNKLMSQIGNNNKQIRIFKIYTANYLDRYFLRT